MAITLVPKYVRALAEQLNAYYRVLKGVDADSVELRLPGGGRFAVHHSGTNAIVFQVTDAGATGSYLPGDVTTPDIADGAVTSAKIADNEIVNADINAAAGILLTKIQHVGANNVLRSTAGVNVGGQVVSGDIADDTIVNADINSAAAIAVTKIQHVGAGNVLRSTGLVNVGGPLVAADIPANSITSAKIVDNEIVNADINSNAQIAITKIQDVGAGNVLRSDGAGNLAGKVVSGDIADGTIVNVDVNAGAAISPSKLAAVTAGQILKDVGSGVVGGGLLVDANVAAAGTANIALGKLAPGASGLVKSNGTAISAGNQLVAADLPTGGAAIITSAMIVDGTIATADMTANTINGDRIADLSIASSKLITGAPISPGSVGPAELAAGTGMRKLADTTLGAAATSVDFPNISQAYASLIIIGTTSDTTGGANVYARLSFDGTTFDATANYDIVYMNQNNVGFGGNVIAADTGFLVGATTSFNTFAPFMVEIPLYAGTGNYKGYRASGLSVVSFTAGGYTMQTLGGMHRASTAPVKGVQLRASTGQFVTGSRFMLFGTPGTLG